MRVSVFLLAALAACTAEQPTPKTIPPELAPIVEREERHGRLIHAKDSAAAFATDVAINQLTADGRSRGWIVVPNGNGWLVRFMTADAKAMIDVDVTPGQPAGITAFDPPRTVPADQAAMFRARQTAARQDFRACSTKYNSVVLPLEAGGWMVYLLATASEPGKVVIGGHHRFEISRDGRTVISAEPLSFTCLETGNNSGPKAERLVARYVTHLVTSTPIAIHVFLSLLHDAEFLVGTPDNHLWAVANGTIGY